jgi:flagellar FliJ protein
MAQRFKFRLDPLLRIRLHEEDRRKQALAEVVGRLNEQTGRAHRYDEMIRDEHHRLGPHLVGPLDVRELAWHRGYVNSVMRAMVETLCERARTQQDAAHAQRELIEAVKRRKVIDTLRQRRLDEWRRDMDRREQAELDELGVRITQLRIAD